MNIRLFDILSVQDKKEDIEATLDINNVVFQDVTYDILGKPSFIISLSNIDKKKVGVKLNTVITLNMLCSRCLKEVACDYPINIEEVIDLSEEESNDLIEDINYVEAGVLYVDKLILDELVPMLPIRFLCTEDCKGICKVCGTNLNEKDCGCDQHVMDPRMAVFGDVFKQFNLDDK